MRAKNEDTKIRIYEYINEYIKNNRISPTINEIAKNAGCAVSTAYKFLERLKDEGLIDTAGRGRITSSVNNWERTIRRGYVKQYNLIWNCVGLWSV